MLESPPWVVIATALAAAHLLGIVSAISALMSTRTPQGSVAWILSLIFAPWLAVPLYWLFGPSRFDGYVSARRGDDSTLRDLLRHPPLDAEPYTSLRPGPGTSPSAIEHLARLPILGGNETEPLHDGDNTYASILEGMNRAQRYVLFQFYILRDDPTGHRFRDALIECARRGVDVYLLVDRVGSFGLPKRYFDELLEGGVNAAYFSSMRRWPARLQLNFRNHRKVVVVDGAEAWTGGFNIGEEYLGHDPETSPWRDTHLRIRGPAALGLQLTFVEDWYWAVKEVLELDWTPHPVGAEGADSASVPDGGKESGPPLGEDVLVIPSGPSDPVETASLLMQHAIHSAADRMWIASPYFVPDRSVQDALRLAVLRGVDVRILIPRRADSRLIDIAGFAFHGDLLEAGVRIFRYRKGFLHCKTAVVDDSVAAVGTVNLDNRSLRLNFEVTAVLFGKRSISILTRHFEEDFSESDELRMEQVTDRPLLARVASRLVYLFAPLL
ncbi:MAG: cardiolipin synthase [Gemmatimonadales bacterium]|nr:MAG: cardiolipin synthase [Gemmatimonadales bacterium]